MRSARSGVGALLLSVVLTGGCATGPFADDAPIPTLPDAELPPVPTLDPSAPPVPATATDPPTPPPAGGATPPPTAPPPTTPPPTAQAPPTEPPDPVALGRTLGVDGIVDLLVEDPMLAGARGPDLLRDLQRIAEGGDRPDPRQIETLYGRIPDWVDDGELDSRIGTAAEAALEQAFQQAAPPRDDDDEGDDDD